MQDVIKADALLKQDADVNMTLTMSEYKGCLLTKVHSKNPPENAAMSVLTIRAFINHMDGHPALSAVIFRSLPWPKICQCSAV